MKTAWQFVGSTGWKCKMSHMKWNNEPNRLHWPIMGASLCKVNCCKEGLQRALQPIRIYYLSELCLQPIIIGYLPEFFLPSATCNTSDNPATFWRDTPINQSACNERLTVLRPGLLSPGGVAGLALARLVERQHPELVQSPPVQLLHLEPRILAHYGLP